jgi:signal transduction histidine kinase
MKLLNKTSRYYIWAALGVFLIGGLFFFVMIRAVIKQELTEKLWNEKAQIVRQLSLKDSLPGMLFSSGDTVLIAKVPEELFAKTCALTDTVVYETNEGQEEIPCTMLTFFVKSPHNIYKVKLLKSLIENDALVEGLSKAFLVLIVLFLTALFMINRKISTLLWSPFYESLKKIQAYEIAGTQALALSPTDIDEFKALNEVVTTMTQTIQDDYKRLKEFTENASHEIQTPLAIIQSKLEMLIQAENLGAENMHHVQAVYEACGRLSRLNKSLLLLTKIENNQFQAFEKVNFSAVVKRHIANFEELIAARELALQVIIDPDVMLLIHPSLADVLVSNLLTNAIKHNLPKGHISVELRTGLFAVSNTGRQPDQDPQIFFERFRKNVVTSESLGLGLSIVKQICEVSMIGVQYSFSAGRHQIRLNF